MADQSTPVVGRNGVVIRTQAEQGAQRSSYRTYEVYQRERVGESTEKIKPIQLVSEDYRRDPYPVLATLREHYPCYRDWLANRYWLTRYDDVTSVFVDDANFETRAKLWFYGLESFGRNFGANLDVLRVEERAYDDHSETLAQQLAGEIAAARKGDIARSFAARLPLELLALMLDIEPAQRDQFYALYWRAQRGATWVPTLQRDGVAALHGLNALFTPIIEQRRKNPGEDLISVMLGIDDIEASDVTTTILERDHQTLHGALANLWRELLTNNDAWAATRSDRRLMKTAYLETLRHSTPVLSAPRFTRHEVERFGQLLPEGALVMCSAAGANRDPRVFAEPDRFIVDRRDLCQREARGQYRADGLASGIAFGLGKPSVHPAVPEDRPRSLYAYTRDAAVTASMVLAETLADYQFALSAAPQSYALSVGEMHTCWSLPVTLR